MLRAVAIQNFIKFRDHQSLKFENGANFVVGPNASGKSAIFELIRRCLSNTVNSTTSTVPDETLPAFVICKFEQELPGKPEKRHVYSCVYIKPPANDSPRESIKFVCVRQLSKENKPGRNETKEECYVDHYHHFDDRTETQTFRNSIDTLSEDLDSLIDEGFLHCNLDNLITKIKGDTQQTESVSECEPILREIHDAVVVTFPIRSPGPTQWSHSKNIGAENKNYDMASNKAEILQELMESNDVNKEESDKMFEMIIHPLKYHFKRDPKYSTITVNDGEKDIPLLKVPVGIIEAKQFSLMFVHRKYQTLLLEEPDRGMHPHMIQKLRNLVIRRQNKDRKLVLLLTSHQPAMVNRWAMDRMFVCRRKRTNNGEFKHSVFRLKHKIENTYQEQDKLKQMLYSACVLFVEGITDKTVVESVFDRVLEAEHLDGFTKENLLDLQKVVSGIQVISIDGSTQYNVLKTMSENLELPCAFLFDSDTMFECFANVRPKPGVKKWRISTLFCVRILLKRINRESSETSRYETKNGTFERVMDALKVGNQSVQERLGLEERDLSDVKWKTVVSFIQSVVLPEKFKLRSNVPYALPQNIDSEDHQLIRLYMKEKNVFLWDSGNLEDMICRSILESGDQTEEHHTNSSKSSSTGRQGKENLLQELFLCEKYDEEANNPKDPVKETLKQMDITTAENITDCLLNSTEIKAFLKFLQQVEEKRS